MNKKIWCAVSGHGYGHFSQMAPVLNELGKRIPDLQLHVTGSVPTALIKKMVACPFTHDARARDVGMIQSDPMTMDLPATASAIRQLHHNWPARIQTEARLMTDWAPDIILADIPYLSLAACHLAGIPGIALSSLTWDQILAAYFAHDPELQPWLDIIQTAYAKTTLALLLTPALSTNPFPHTHTIPPVTTPGIPQPDALRHDLGIDDQRPIILITLGGIPTNAFPFTALAADDRFHWLMDAEIPLPRPNHIHPLHAIQHWVFGNVTASVDGIISKPGYGMAISSAAHQIPFLYVTRGIFPDEVPITNWLKRHSRALAMDRATFDQGQFGTLLIQLLNLPLPPKPDVHGASVAADMIINRFF
ncbi:MAG: hypothetical protein H7839_17290 [Magnetococcus sp. YQC-5]